jgi:hypothetical protein
LSRLPGNTEPVGAPRALDRYTQIAYSKGVPVAPMTIVETEEFLRKSRPLISDSDRAALVAFVGANPEAGEIIRGTGGVRKIRWALEGMGKRGGARVIYYYHNERLPVFLLSAYAKNRKADLSQAERNAMRRLVTTLVTGYPRKA